MHEKRVTSAELAKEANVSTAYVSLILSGSRTPANGKTMLEEAFQKVLENRKEDNNGKVQHQTPSP
jgi:DNA-binding LacI/PurR family transcriptional regulator